MDPRAQRRILLAVQAEYEPLTRKMDLSITRPPPTALSDVLLLFALSLVGAGVLHLLRGWTNVPSREAGVLSRHASASGPGTQDRSGELLTRVRGFQRGWLSFLLTWLPLVVMVAGYTGCSLLRDAGYLIFPWPILGVAVAGSVVMASTEFIRGRRTKRILRGG